MVTFLIVVLRIAAPFAFAVVHLLTPDTLAVPERKKKKRKGGRNLFCFSAKKIAASKAVVFYRDAMEAYRRQLVMRALAPRQGNRATAARTLGLFEKYLLWLLKSLRILIRRVQRVPASEPCWCDNDHRPLVNRHAVILGIFGPQQSDRSFMFVATKDEPRFSCNQNVRELSPILVVTVDDK